MYIYRTSDGRRIEASIEAESRDAAFAALRERGIRPIKVIAKDGTKANGEAIQRVRRPWAAVAVVLALAAAVGVSAAFLSKRGGKPEAVPPREAATVAKPLVRQTIPGDRQRIENAKKTLFASPVESLLAQFAEPGRQYLLPTKLPDDAEARAAITNTLRTARSELSEEIDLKRIVSWMKREMRTYMAAGNSFGNYVSRLEERQKKEIAHHATAEKRLAELLAEHDQAKAYNYWLKANAQLQSMGIYPIPLPDALRDYQFNLNLDE